MRPSYHLRCSSGHLRVERRIRRVNNASHARCRNCGPAYEPIDEVRRITNQSTGELVTWRKPAGSGFEVLCLRGEEATRPGPTNAEVLTFSTNASLWTLLEKLTIQPAAVFHAAAPDFVTIEGAAMTRKKSTRPDLRVILRPAVKVLPRRGRPFSKAVIVGWKYELDGSAGRRSPVRGNRSNPQH